MSRRRTTTTDLMIFEFSTASGECRWVAAPDEETAAAVAAKKGWKGSPGQIYKGYTCLPKDDAGLRQFGCDVIVRKSTKEKKS